MRTLPRAAFFDVDETLIGVKSMFDFLRFWLLRNGGDESDYERAMAAFRGMWSEGVPRPEVNRAYYRRFAGTSWTDLLSAGQDWYDNYRHRPDAFVLASVDALRRHAGAGDTTVLVSGSFLGCLDPLARELRADIVLCSEPLLDAEGRVTGEVRRPMIGDAKADAVLETLARLGVDGADCAGYGDHSSDLGMLRLLGRPHVIGGHDAVLADHAARLGWPVLPAETGSFAQVAVLG
ncbi:HAD family hydrolase [Streptomyces sp. LaPpAH-108]|uniref:HAD family hydrolase n=1 Tax=Streptomyces sp. LaPpAH-108 TaxID=1155714 RepID=UPI00036469CB|nr:HAD-IB family hydrolase [Streptomyces sp. LaPpAH-108]